jgi:hypothetical protein
MCLLPNPHERYRKSPFVLWEHLAGTRSEYFVAGEHRQIAVKVSDDRGNGLMVIEKL